MIPTPPPMSSTVADWTPTSLIVSTRRRVLPLGPDRRYAAAWRRAARASKAAS